MQTLQPKHLFIALVIFAGTIIISALVLSSASLSIRTTQTQVGNDGAITNAISVTGDGTAVAEPDLVNISVTVSETAQTTQQAQEQTNAKVAQIIDIATNNGVDEQDIKTTQLSLNPKYEYENRTRVFKGYDAVQTLEIQSKYVKGDTAVPTMLDQIAAINNVQINGISFDVENRKALAEQARELAYKSAEEKAKQLASLSGVSLGKPISLTDYSQQFNEGTMKALDMAFAESPVAGGAPTTQIMGGELEHTITIDAVFAIE